LGLFSKTPDDTATFKWDYTQQHKWHPLTDGVDTLKLTGSGIKPASWIQIELRTTGVSYYKNAIIDEEGWSKAPNSQEVIFDIPPGYYTVVVHSNNVLSVKTPAPVYIEDGLTVLDFTTSAYKKELKAIGNSYAMWSGDVSGVKVNGSKSSRFSWGGPDNSIFLEDWITVNNTWVATFGVLGNWLCDLNGDGYVNDVDLAIVYNNLGKISSVPYIGD
jgi:hypothetical protein